MPALLETWTDDLERPKQIDPRLEDPESPLSKAFVGVIIEAMAGNKDFELDPYDLVNGEYGAKSIWYIYKVPRSVILGDSMEVERSEAKHEKGFVYKALDPKKTAYDPKRLTVNWGQKDRIKLSEELVTALKQQAEEQLHQGAPNYSNLKA